MNTKPLLTILIILLASCYCLQAQEETTPEHELKVNYVNVNAKDATVEVFINAKVDGRYLSASQLGIDSVYEAKGGKGEVDRIPVRRLTNIDEEGNDAVSDLQTTLLFLLDRSGSMGPNYGNKIENAKRQIRAILESQNIPPGWAYFAAFSREKTGVQPLTLETFDEVVGSVDVAYKEATWLNNAISESLDWLSSRDGRKIIFLLTDGKDVAQKDILFDENRYVRQEDLFAKVTKLSSDYAIYSIGYGNKDESAEISGIDEPFLQELSLKTANRKDRYDYVTSNVELGDILSAFSSDVTYNIKLKYQPKDLSYAGDRRTITIPYQIKNTGIKGEQSIDYAYGTPIQAKVIHPQRRTGFNFGILVWGIIVVLLALLILGRLFPIFAFQRFRNLYVMKYSEYRKKKGLDSGRVRRVLEDPYTGLPFEPNQDVVARCEHVMTLESWFANGDQCVYYPNRCKNGNGNYRKGGSFFSQQGQYRKLNWLWFGMVGGLTGWLVYALMDAAGWSEQLAQRLNGLAFFKNTFGDLANTYAAQLLIGFSLGFMLSLALATVEEMGQSRKFNLARILLRGVIGALLAPIVFFLGQLIQMYVIGNPIPRSDIDHLVIWVLLGTFLGWAMTIRSSIEWQKGLQGGAIASVVAFLCFIFFKEVIFRNSGEYANMFGFVIFGAVLGIITVAVVEKLEDFELEFLSPKAHTGRRVGISKWLRKDGDNIRIGTSSDCEVFIKWKDKNVRGHHAELSYNGKIFIKPLSGETLLNRIQITDAKELKNKDEITLGVGGETSMQFLIKESAESSTAAGPAARVDASKEAAMKEKIKITVRK